MGLQWKARCARARTLAPGYYCGPPKRNELKSVSTFVIGDNPDVVDERPYDPRSYDSRYARDYEDRRCGGRDYDHRGGTEVCRKQIMIIS